VADSPFTASLAALSRFFVGDATLEDTLERVAGLAVEAIAPADMAGVTMVVEGARRTPVFTHASAPEIDEAQYATGKGPCVQALESGQVTEIASTCEPGRFEEFRAAAAAHGVLSTLSFPLLVDQRPVGALNLYSRRERAFGDAERSDGAVFAAHAAIVLANAHAYWDARELSTGLGEAMKNRAVIEQAKGMLMAAEGLDEEEAFAVLVRASQRQNVKLSVVASRLMEGAVARRRSQRPKAPPRQ
jgi:GAF domain-containing protein